MSISTGSRDTSTGVLAGLNVIDFGHYFAGPLAGLLLADQGANVIRIVKPGKPELPESRFRVFNRNKKILALDLKTPEGKAQALALIQKADVLIENFRPGVMQRLGLDYSTLKKDCPGLIYLSLPGFASTDTERAQLQAWEGVMSAAAGVYTMTSEFREMLHYPPVYTAVLQCSTYGGIQGAMAVMAALIAREEHRIGTVIEVPLVEAGLTAFGGDVFGKRPYYSVRAMTDSESETDIPLPESLKACTYSAQDSREVQAEKLERARLEMMKLYFMYNLYPCADGREIYIYLSYSFARRLLKLIGVEQQVINEGFVIENPWEFSLDNNIGTFGSGLNAERKARLIQIIKDALKARPAEEWETLMTNAGIHAAMLRTREEWLALQAHQDSGFMTKLGHGDNELTMPGYLAGITGPQGELPNTIVAEMESVTIDEAEALFNQKTCKEWTESTQPPLKKGDLLKGLKILDLANFVAGPTTNVHLAEFGAEVIKADPVRYDTHTGVILLFANEGKRSLLMELNTGPGREIFRRLVNWADLVTHNSVDGTADRLGATFSQLKQIKPEIVVCQMGAYCGPVRGGWGERGGNEPLVQAACGIMAQFGSLEKAHRHSQVGIGDVPGGYCGAFTALLGIYQQRKTGQGSECRTSLGQAANYVQLPYMIAQHGRSDWGEPTGQFALGEHWWQRLYACADGWIFVDARESGAARLCGLVTGQPFADVQALEAGFAEQDKSYWLDRLHAADIACHAAINIEEILKKAPLHPIDNDRADEEAKGAGEIHCWENHPCGAPVNVLAPDSVRVGEKQSYLRISAAPRLGEHSVEILRDLNFQEEEIQQLLKYRVVHEYFPPLKSKGAYLFPVEETA